MVKEISIGIISTLLIIILITIYTKLDAISSSDSISYSDIDSIWESIVESGVTLKPFDKEDPLLKKRQILIASSINENLAHDVISKLLYLDSINNDSIYVIISSNGGWGSCAKSIIETFNVIKSPVNTIGVGNCFSSGSLISVSATGKRYATKNTLFMVHANLPYPKENKSFDKYYNQWYESIWKDNSKLPIEWFPMTKDKSYYFNCEEAIKYKVIDQIIDKLK